MALVVVSAAASFGCLAAGPAVPRATSNSELRITGEVSDFDRISGSLVFRTNVIAVIGDTILHADLVKAFHNPKAREGFDSIVATGNLKFETPDRVLTGDKGVWNSARNTTRITGTPNVRVRQKDGNEIITPEIIYDMTLDRITFVGRTEVRVQVGNDLKENWNETMTNDTVSITADGGGIEQSTGCVVFRTNVLAMIGDRVLRADAIEAYQDAGTKGGFRSIVATGHIRLETPSPDRIVTGDRGVWDRKLNTIRITGVPNVQVQEEDGRELVAQAVVYDVSGRKFSVEGRAQARVKLNSETKKSWDNNF